MTSLLVSLVVLTLSGCNALQLGPTPDGPGSPAMLATGSAETPQNLPKSRYGNPPTYTVFGKQYRVMDTAAGYQARGTASWYGSKFHGRRTSSGETYNMYDMTAAHKSLPLPTWVRVTHLETGASLVVKVNDRGPFVDNRLIDLSYAAASKLGVLETGTAPVEITALTVNTEPMAEQVTGDQPAARFVRSTPETQQDSAITVVQVGAFGAWENAEAFRRRVDKAININAAYIVQDPDRPLHKVRFKIANNAPVKKIIQQLEAAGIRQFAVVK
ncbi:MAG: septal ring lytic transglycosylase RlpA family protein [Gammaproteobacteria bacterium]|nr:septal ring lytic transglycosylase RlpA family protein [Gammaproteobacteria bacterium]